MLSRLLPAAVAAGLAAHPAAAQDVTISGGLTLTGRYVSNGQPQTTGAALQPSLEIGAGGFHAGIWASNVSPALTGRHAEIDLSLGYRHDLGPVSLDAGYTRYFYTGPNVNCCGDLVLDAVTTPRDGTDLGLSLAYDPQSKVSNAALTLSQAVGDRLVLAMGLGRVANDHRYWSLGASMAVTPNVTATLTWHDTDTGRGLAVLSADYAFGPD